MMSPNRRHRKPDLFGVLLVVVGLGVSVSVAYQLSVHRFDEISIATIAQIRGR